MVAKSGGNPAKHFGAQMRRERLAKGWSLDRFAAETGVDPATASLIERGHRGPNLRVAEACDKAYPRRDGYFVAYFEEMQTWAEVPAAFKSWSDREAATPDLRDWWPAVVSGLLQTAEYAEALLWTYPDVTAEQVSARLTARMERQERLFARQVRAWFLVDELSLHRLVGTPEVMAGQIRKLLEVGKLPNVTLQVMPPVGHPGVSSGFILADEALYAESSASGGVYTGETVAAHEHLFDTLRSEAHRVSESVRIIEGLGERWTAHGGRAHTAGPTEGLAPRWPAGAE
jgi:transcriptional regulator with XRE-family HTH domain